MGSDGKDIWARLRETRQNEKIKAQKAEGIGPCLSFVRVRN